jgi:hypothetical protein
MTRTCGQHQNPQTNKNADDSLHWFRLQGHLLTSQIGRPLRFAALYSLIRRKPITKWVD